MLPITEADAATFDWSDPGGVAAELRGVVAAATAADPAAPLDEASLLQLRHRGLEGARLWTTPGGFALRRPAELDLVVTPDARGRGLGGDLAAAALADVTDDDALSAWSHGDHPAAARLAERHGFARARELWVMRRETAEPLPATRVGDDVRVRGFDRRSDDDAADLLAVNAAAFASHPEQGSLDEAGLRERMAEDWFDPAGLFLARDAGSGELLGFHWTKVHPAHGSDPAFGEVYVVGVSPGCAGPRAGLAADAGRAAPPGRARPRRGGALRRVGQRARDRGLPPPRVPARGARHARPVPPGLRREPRLAAPAATQTAPLRRRPARSGCRTAQSARRYRYCSAALSLAAISAVLAGASCPMPTMFAKPWISPPYRFISTRTPASASLPRVGLPLVAQRVEPGRARGTRARGPAGCRREQHRDARVAQVVAGEVAARRAAP